MLTLALASVGAPTCSNSRRLCSCSGGPFSVSPLESSAQEVVDRKEEEQESLGAESHMEEFSSFFNTQNVQKCL